jgi:hypothetical protein
MWHTLWNIFGVIGVIACAVIVIIVREASADSLYRRRSQKRNYIREAVSEAAGLSLGGAVDCLRRAGIYYEIAKNGARRFCVPKYFWDTDSIRAKTKAFITLVTNRKSVDGNESQEQKIQRDLVLFLMKQAKKTPGPVLALVAELGRQAGGNPLFKEFFAADWQTSEIQLFFKL